MSFAIAFVAGALGVFSIITGAILLTRETRFSFRILREEKDFLTERVQQLGAGLTQSPAQNQAQN